MLGVALLGFGVVGSGAAQVITDNQDRIRQLTGDGIEIRSILDLREFPDSPFADKIVHDFDVILHDPSVDVVVEMMGGSHPALEYTRAALEAGKSVVTSNKEVVARYGTELLALARKNGVQYLFEASVGGGIPVIRPLARDMAANRVRAINGILNGTTNYILTRMVEAGVSFDEALAEAQQLGYAERDPSADVDGMDAARKIVILAAVAGGVRIDAEAVDTTGIRAVTARDVRVAAALGCAVKLIAHAVFGAQNKLTVWVAPCFVPKTHPLYAICDVFNGILIDTDMLGQTLFYGRGAGKLPTAGAIVSDLTDLALHRVQPTLAPQWSDATAEQLGGADDESCRYCLIFHDAQTMPSAWPQDTQLRAIPDASATAVVTPVMTGKQLTELLSLCESAPKVYRCLAH